MQTTAHVEIDTAQNNGRSIALRPLRILECIAEANVPLTVLEVARDMGVDRSTAYRILVNLTEAGYLERDASGTRYALAHKVLWLARSLLEQDDSNARINAALTDLAAMTGETVHYSVVEGASALLTHSAKGKQRLSVDVAIGDRSPLHATSAGKILLAFSEQEFVDSIIQLGLPRFAANTITDAARFREELENVRARGFAYDLHEFADDMQCVAVPVFGRRNRIHGTISFSGPDSRFNLDHLNRLRCAALPKAMELSAGLPNT